MSRALLLKGLVFVAWVGAAAAGCGHNWDMFEPRDAAAVDVRVDASCGTTRGACCAADSGMPVCGRGLACTANATCQLCASGLVECSNQCVNAVVDPNNCGRCGNVCPANRMVCFDSMCTTR